MKRTIWFSFFALILIFVLAACNNENNDNNDTEEAGATPVEVEKIKQGDLTVERALFGRVEPEKKTPVMPEAPGKVTEVLVKNGDKVKKDDDLIKIDGPAGEETLQATQSGHIANLSLKKDDMASNEDPALVILDTAKLTATFEVTEKMRNNFKVDKKVEISHQDKTYKGNITSMDIVPGESGLFPITVEIKNDKNAILTGTVVALDYKEVLEKDALLVPTAAIISELDEDYIYRVEDGQAKKVDIEVIETQSELSAIKADVKEDEQVIVKGQFIVKDGTEIDVKKGNES